MIRPFKKNPFGKVTRFSPLDTRPKKDSTDKRVTLNLSYPFEGNSINSSINMTEYSKKEDMKVKYPSVDNLANIIRCKSKFRKVRIMKRDLRRAYCQLFSSPETIHLLG